MTPQREYFSAILVSCSAAWSRAWSQLIRCHLPSPLFPLRSKGYLSRSGSYSCSMPALPRAHNIPRDLRNLGLGSNLVTTPSSTLAISPHLFKHISQAEKRFSTFAGKPSFFSGTRACKTGVFAPVIEAAVAAPVHLRKLRREIGLSALRDICHLHS